MVSRSDLYRLSDSGPVVSSIGTTRVGTVPFMLILQISASTARRLCIPLQSDSLEVRGRKVLQKSAYHQIHIRQVTRLAPGDVDIPDNILILRVALFIQT